jgi:poly-beta-hydroxyalkanoate depolymerase
VFNGSRFRALIAPRIADFHATVDSLARAQKPSRRKAAKG